MYNQTPLRRHRDTKNKTENLLSLRMFQVAVSLYFIHIFYLYPFRGHQEYRTTAHMASVLTIILGRLISL